MHAYNLSLYNPEMRITRGGRSLRRALAKARLTQVMLAERLGVTQQAVSAWLNDRRQPSAKHRAELERIVGARCGVDASPD